MKQDFIPSRIFTWLQGAIDDWLSEGIVDASQAARLESRYMAQQDGLWLGWVLGLLAAMLIGGGVILLLAYNWYELTHLTRACIAVSPLLLLQGGCLWLLWRRRTTGLAGEMAALLLGAAQGAALALVSQTYHLYGEQWQFIALWFLMVFPSAILLQSQALFVAAMVLLPSVLVSAPWVYTENTILIPTQIWWGTAVALLGAGSYAFYMRQIVCRWAFLLALLVCTFIWLLAHSVGEAFYYAFPVLYAAGLAQRENGWRNAMRWLGGVGIYASLLAVVLAPELQLELAEVSWQEVLLSVGLTGMSVWMAMRNARQRLRLPYRWVLLGTPFFMWAFSTLFEYNSVVNFGLLQLFLLLAGLILVAGGLALSRLLVTNAGLILLVTHFLMRFFDSEWSLLSRGIGFIVCGVMLLGINILLLRRRARHQMVIEPVFAVRPPRTVRHHTIFWVVMLLLCMAQVGYVLNTIVQAELTLSEGSTYRFKTQPVDPYDPFRGRYVWLNFALEDELFMSDGKTCAEWRLAPALYGVLSRDAEGIASITELTMEQPKSTDALRLAGIKCGQDGIYINLPFHRFYANELLAPELEAQAREHSDNSYLVVRIRGDYAVPENLEIGVGK
ncbi:GDYXXLXY domain-containing protein [Cardiobacteriaceae bacterium TAE3-ERU3]|nr:GDYXXLXY domain-containing protein [Cardiobacteriaceae bacterium TAE3-ERU3]